MRWGCWSRCPARGFQQFLPCLAPRLHLGTACCTAGSGPGPPAVQTIILHSSTCPSTAARAAASCSPSNVMLLRRVLESWQLIALHPGWCRVVGAAEVWARQQGGCNTPKGPQRVYQPSIQVPRGHRPSMQACSCSGQHTADRQWHLRPALARVAGLVGP